MFYKYLPWLVLLAGIQQVLVPYFVITQGFFNNSDLSLLYVQPASWTFAIWGLIYTLASIYTIWQFAVHIQGNDNPILVSNRLYALLLFIGSSVWLLASNFSQEYLWITFVVLFGMAYVGFKAVSLPMGIIEEADSRKERLLSRIILMPYAAWVNIAVFVNFGSVVGSYDISLTDTGWLIINLALLSGIVFVTWTQFQRLFFNPWYGLVVVWASVGIVFANNINSGSKIIAVLAGLTGLLFLWKSIVYAWYFLRK